MRSNQLSYPAPARIVIRTRAPKGNRTLDLFLTMETLCRLSYWGNEKILYTSVSANAKLFGSGLAG